MATVTVEIDDSLLNDCGLLRYDCNTQSFHLAKESETFENYEVDYDITIQGTEGNYNCECEELAQRQCDGALGCVNRCDLWEYMKENCECYSFFDLCEAPDCNNCEDGSFIRVKDCDELECIPTCDVAYEIGRKLKGLDDTCDFDFEWISCEDIYPFLESADTDLLTINPCDNGKIVFQIKNHDEKVALQSGCEAKYLGELLNTESCLFKWNTDNCQANLIPDFPEDCDEDSGSCWVKPRAMTTLIQSVTISQPTSQENAYYLSSVDIPELDNRGWIRQDASFETFSYGGMNVADGIIRTNRNGFWDLKFVGSQEQNKGVHGTRVGLILIYGNEVRLVPQTRYSGTDSFLYETQPTTPGASFSTFGDNQYTTSFGGQSLPNGGTYSMGRVIERFPVGGSIRWGLPEGTLIVPAVKFSTFMTGDDDAAIEGQISILGKEEVSADGFDAFIIQAKYDDDIYNCCNDGQCIEPLCNCL